MRSSGPNVSRSPDAVVAVGLTGGVAAGKSTALAMFGELGAHTFSADQVVHELYELAEVKTAVHARFGGTVFAAGGAVDRRALAHRVLADDGQLRWLEALIHPRVEHEMYRALSRGTPGSILVFEVPLLFDVGMESMFDLTVTIEAERGERERRLTASRSGLEFEEFDARQLKSEARVARADMAYVNDRGLSELRAFIESAYQRALELVEEKIQDMLRDKQSQRARH